MKFAVDLLSPWVTRLVRALVSPTDHTGKDAKRLVRSLFFVKRYQYASYLTVCAEQVRVARQSSVVPLLTQTCAAKLVAPILRVLVGREVVCFWLVCYGWRLGSSENFFVVVVNGKDDGVVAVPDYGFSVASFFELFVVFYLARV